MLLTVLDVIVIAVVLMSAALAMIRGFVREVLSNASWLIAAVAADTLYQPFLPLVRPYFESATVALIVTAAAVFFIALLLASYITMKISDFVIDSRVGAVDRALGFLFGAARGGLLLVIALLFFNWLVPEPPRWVAEVRSERSRPPCAASPSPRCGRRATPHARSPSRSTTAPRAPRSTSTCASSR